MKKIVAFIGSEYIWRVLLIEENDQTGILLNPTIDLPTPKNIAKSNYCHYKRAPEYHKDLFIYET